MRTTPLGLILILFIETLTISLAISVRASLGKRATVEAQGGAGEIKPRNTNNRARRTAPAAKVSAAEPFAGATERVFKEKPDADPSRLHDIRVARHAGFDRVVFEFAGDVVPGYEIEYFFPPARLCAGSLLGHGELKGTSWLAVRLAPMHENEPSDLVSITKLQLAVRRNRLPVLKGLDIVCQADGRQEWTLGLSSHNPFRVLELSNPSRLVVDIKH